MEEPREIFVVQESLKIDGSTWDEASQIVKDTVRITLGETSGKTKEN